MAISSVQNGGAYFPSLSDNDMHSTSNALAAVDGSLTQAAFKAPSSELNCDEVLSNTSNYKGDPYGDLLVGDCERQEYAPGSAIDSGPTLAERFFHWLGDKTGF